MHNILRNLATKDETIIATIDQQISRNKAAYNITHKQERQEFGDKLNITFLS